MKTKLKPSTIYIPDALKDKITRVAKANSRTFTKEALVWLQAVAGAK